MVIISNQIERLKRFIKAPIAEEITVKIDIFFIYIKKMQEFESFHSNN